MILKLDRKRKITLLKWLKAGAINTDEMPELNATEKTMAQQQAMEFLRKLDEEL